MRRTIAALAILTLGIASCSRAPSPEAGPALVVLAENGTVKTVDLDGATEVLAGQPNDGISRFQPIWTPDGTAVTFSEAGPSGAALVQISVTEDRTIRTKLGTRPFYFYWDPTGRRVASLRNLDDEPLILELIDAEGNVDIAGFGQPFYYSWEPTGERIATHRSRPQIEVISPGEATIVDEQAGEFQATWWTDQGIWYVRRVAGSQRVSLLQPGEEPRDLAEVIGFVFLSPSPTDDRLAVQSLVGSQGGTRAAYQALPVLPADRLSVIDVATLEVKEVTDGPVLAFFWSPDGSHLLLLAVGQAEGTLRWVVWSDEGTRSFDDFVPSVVFFRDFLGFFDQYAQSMSLWAADSSAFAFPGTVAGSNGVFIQHLDSGLLERVTDGVWVAWSPVADGG